MIPSSQPVLLLVYLIVPTGMTVEGHPRGVTYNIIVVVTPGDRFEDRSPGMIELLLNTNGFLIVD